MEKLPSTYFRLVNHTVHSPSAVSRAGDDLRVTEEATAGQVTWPIKDILDEKAILWLHRRESENKTGVKASKHGLTCVCRQLTHNLNIAVLALEVVDGAHVVQTAAGYQVPRRRIGTSHHPGWLERDGVHLRTHGRPVKNLCVNSQLNVLHSLPQPHDMQQAPA